MQHSVGFRGARWRNGGVALTALALLSWPACSKGPAASPAGTAAAAAPTAQPAAPPSTMQTALGGLGHAVSRAETQPTEAHLAVTRAKSGELLDVAQTPLRVALLRYESPAEAAKALQQVVLWINGSGLLHNGEATADGDTVIVVGTVDTAPPTPETRALFDKYIDGFLEAE